MIFKKNDYLEINTSYDFCGIEIEFNDKRYKIEYPKHVWEPLDENIKESIVDHVAFLSTNYLPLVLNKKGVIYDTRIPMFDSFSFKSMLFDLSSSAILDGRRPVDYVREYHNLDFVFESQEPVVWSKSFEPEDSTIISFTSGKESLLTLAMCMELGLDPVLINVVEPSNTHEHKHKKEILRELNREFGIRYFTVPHEVGLFHDSKWMGSRETSLGWGNQLMYYMFLYLPFIYQHRPRYLFYGNEFSCDKETVEDGFRANFCYDQSSHWTVQQDIMMRIMTGGSTRVGSLVGPLNEIAVVKCLHKGFPKIAKYQMSCFCEDPVTEKHRWCCNCSKCARNYAFIRAVGGDVEGVGFWCDMFRKEYRGLFSALNGNETYGFDRSGLGREEQELALFLAGQLTPGNELLREAGSHTKYHDGESEGATQDALRNDYELYFTPQDYSAIPTELRERVYEIYKEILGTFP